MMRILSNIRDEISALPVGAKQLKDFAYLVGGIFVALAALGVWRSGPTPLTLSFGIIGVVLVLLGFAAPSALIWPYRAWMSFGIITGYFVFRGLLIFVFFLVFTPIGFITRVFGRDVLRLKPPASGPTYWISAPKNHDMKEPY